MKKRFDFNATICQTSIFQYKKMEEKDLELLKQYYIKTWNDEDFEDESILKWGYWTIDKNRDMLLKALGGGSFEIPEMYAFVFKAQKVHIECGGGGNPLKICKRNKDGSYDEEIMISRLDIPTHLFDFKDEIIASIAEAFAVESFRAPRLNRLSVIF